MRQLDRQLGAGAPQLRYFQRGGLNMFSIVYVHMPRGPVRGHLRQICGSVMAKPTRCWTNLVGKSIQTDNIGNFRLNTFFIETLDLLKENKALKLIISRESQKTPEKKALFADCRYIISLYNYSNLCSNSKRQILGIKYKNKILGKKNIGRNIEEINLKQHFDDAVLTARLSGKTCKSVMRIRAG